MTLLPSRAPSLLIGTVGDHVIAYDTADETRHRLDPATGLILAACDGRTERATFVSDQAARAGVDPAVIGARIDDTLARFAELGLVGDRPAPGAAPPPASAPPADDPHQITGPTHHVLDLEIRFRGTDRDLLDRIDRYLGTADLTPPAPTSADHPAGRTVEFEIVRHDDGSVDLITDETVGHDHEGTLLRRLVTVTSEHAAATDGCVVLHAGGVRSPDGRIVAFAAPSGSGKSTLTATFVAHRWDYLGDDMLGVAADGTLYGFPKRIGIDPVSRRVVGLGHSRDRTEDPAVLYDDVQRLGGPLGLGPALVVFPTYEAGADPVLEPLEPLGCLDELIGNTLNLAVVGQDGFVTLCRLAETTPAYRLTHGDAVEAVAAIDDLLAHLTDGAAPVGSAAAQAT